MPRDEVDIISKKSLNLYVLRTFSFPVIKFAINNAKHAKKELNISTPKLLSVPSSSFETVARVDQKSIETLAYKNAFFMEFYPPKNIMLKGLRFLLA